MICGRSLRRFGDRDAEGHLRRDLLRGRDIEQKNLDLVDLLCDTVEAPLGRPWGTAGSSRHSFGTARDTIVAEF